MIKLKKQNKKRIKKPELTWVNLSYPWLGSWDQNNPIEIWNWKKLIKKDTKK
jgi:hypothetical protein